MQLQELYHLIRTEPVCLFIGSGFSFYSGMPSAWDIKQRLWMTLTESQQKETSIHKDLKPFCEDYVALNSREQLTGILQELIDIPAKATHIHDDLAKIAYFKTMVTTNYDRLLENCLGDRVSVITGNSDTFQSKPGRTRLFKIHGDIRNPDSIVINSQDYVNQYNRIFKEPFWANVIAEISTKHIIFLGFSYEDENIWADFDFVRQLVPKTPQQRILIGPNLPPLKQKRLRDQEIHYINCDGKQFVDGLIADIKENIVFDHSLGLVDSQTTQEIITAFDLKITIDAQPRFTQVTEISRMDGATRHEVNLQFSDKPLIEAYERFNNDYRESVLTISAEQLTAFSFEIEGFQMQNLSTLKEFKLLHLPKFEGRAKLKFPDHGFTFSKAHCRLFNGIPGKALIEAELAGFSVTFDIIFKEGQAELTLKAQEPNGNYKINKAYEVFRALYLLFSGELLEIHITGHPVLKQRLPDHTKARLFRREMELFHQLKTIQKAFNVEFKSFRLGAVTKTERKLIFKLSRIAQKGYCAYRDADGLIIEQLPELPGFDEAIQSGIVSESMLSLITKSAHHVELFGVNLAVGAEQIILRKPVVNDYDADQHWIRLVPEDGLIIYRYERFGLADFSDGKAAVNTGHS